MELIFESFFDFLKGKKFPNTITWEKYKKLATPTSYNKKHLDGVFNISDKEKFKKEYITINTLENSNKHNDSYFNGLIKNKEFEGADNITNLINLYLEDLESILPIAVNKSYGVIDGFHRLSALLSIFQLEPSKHIHVYKLQ